MNRTTARRARKPRRCADCHARIEVGEIYLTHVASPEHDDLGNETWWRSTECAGCARRYGRGALIEARAAA